MPNPIWHVEIVGDDSDGLVDFYRAALGWEVRETPSLPAFCHLVTGHDNNIACGVGPIDDSGEHRLRFYVKVEDLEATVEAAVQAGATVFKSPYEVSGGPRCAFIIDPEGNHFGLASYNPPRDA